MRVLPWLLCGLAAPALAGSDPLSFQRDVRPILGGNCYACHGADEEGRKADLRLDLREAAVADLGGYAAIVPGDPARSEVMKRLRSHDPEEVMPPQKSGRKLTPEQIAVMERWIREGAVYEPHWSFAKLAPPPVPGTGSAPIDAWVRAAQVKRGLAPEPEADRWTLLRRVTLDLTGLPPTVEEADAFAADVAPGAYERVVDRLLASPRFGEHWARVWLDLARYADSKGYEKDQPRSMWRYRDWVIDAINRDMPFDEFTLRQLAGDLLPGATEEDLVATGFHRNTMTNDEAGTDDEEFRVAAVKDRVDTTGQVWMGLTFGCAKCHTHKYDPISIDGYYRFYAFFNQTEDADRYDDSPTQFLPTAEQKAKLDALGRQRNEAESAFWRPMAGTDDARRTWEAAQASDPHWTRVTPRSVDTRSAAEAAVLPDGRVLISGPLTNKDMYAVRFTLPTNGAALTALRLETLTHESLPRGGPGRATNDPNFVVTEVAFHLGDGSAAPIPLAKARADFEQEGWPAEWVLDKRDDRGWAISPQQGAPHALVLELKSPLVCTGQTVALDIAQEKHQLQLGCFRVSWSTNAPGALSAEDAVAPFLASKPEAQRSAGERKTLEAAWRRNHPDTAGAAKDLARLKQEIDKAKAAVARLPVMRELPEAKRRVTKVHKRGNFLDPGHEVQPAVLEELAPFPAGAPTNRIGVARWLTSPDNPLTPRVAVNRVWARLFGQGLVETEEDFGMQGTLPSHPELLDWLAVQYRDEWKWSLKRLCREIVLTHTYRQSSVVTAAKRAADPRNEWLSRGPRVRLPAESVRDQALFAAGLLSAKMQGPPVMPPQPPGLWKTAYSELKWETSPGEDRHRRAIYTFLRRTSPYPLLTTFDGGSGEICLVRRIRTNTPLQALVTLNDPAFLEAAGGLAQRMREGGGDVPAQMARGVRLVLIRPARGDEAAQLGALYESTLAGFRSDPGAAADLLRSANLSVPTEGAPELAALTTVGNVILNLDETLTKP